MSKFSDKHFCQGNAYDLSWQSGSIGPTCKYVVLDDKHCQGLSKVTDKSFELELGWQWIVDQRKIQKYELSQHTDLKACNEEDQCKTEETDTEEDISQSQSLSSTSCYFSGSAKEYDPGVQLSNTKENLSSEITSRKIAPELDSLQQINILDSPLGVSDHPSRFERFQDIAQDTPYNESTALAQDLESQNSRRSPGYHENCDLPPMQSWKHSCRPVSARSPMVNNHDKADVDENHFTSGMGNSDQALSNRTMASQCSTSSSSDTGKTWRTGGKRDCTTKQAYETLGEALCHSQTRARQAEKCAAEALKEREKLTELLLREALLTRTYKHWLQTLEFENMCLKMYSQCDINVWLAKKVLNRCSAANWLVQDRRLYQNHHHIWKEEHCTDSESESNILVHYTIRLAFALGLSFAGAGLMIGWSIGWLLLAC